MTRLGIQSFSLESTIAAKGFINIMATFLIIKHKAVLNILSQLNHNQAKQSDPLSVPPLAEKNGRLLAELNVIYEKKSKFFINDKSVGYPSCDIIGRCDLGVGSGPYWVRCISDSAHVSSGYLAQVP
ncbi:hypothetical protein [Marinobacterium sp. BA1]|uniref:hypothetical protein n=1 Tax=Marinobacterium sp. BA1 TaxID=3138931 RepID=UPI0034E86743